MRRTSRTSASDTAWSFAKSRLRLALFFSKLWLCIAWRRRILPLPVTLNRFLAALDVFCLGTLRCSHWLLDLLQRREDHDHVPAVLERRRLDRPELLDVVGEAHEEISPAQHDRHLHLGALVQKPDDVPLLRLVVVHSDLGSELDLLHVDGDLVLSGRLRLLFLLVLVLSVVHDPTHGRIGVRRHLHQVEVLRVRVVERLVPLLDPELLARLRDQADPRDANRIVDPRLILDGPRKVGPAAGPQDCVTKLCSISSLTTKAARSSSVNQCLRLNLCGPPALEVRNGCSCLQSSSLATDDPCSYTGAFLGAGLASPATAASSSTSPSRLNVCCSPCRRLTASASRDSRSPQTITNGTFSTSAARIRLPSVSSGSATAARYPAARSSSASDSASVACAAATGRIRICSGASQNGKSPP